MTRLWRWFKAYHRLDMNAVCEMSKGRGLYDDYHDYPDTADKLPWHLAELECARCHKRFCI